MKLAIREADDPFLESLIGRIFHVTSLQNFDVIKRAGVICAHPWPRPESPFGDRTSTYFRSRGCISVFDYSTPSHDQIRTSWRRCCPLDAARPGPAIFVFLPASFFVQLVSWTDWQDEESTLTIVPYVEAGYPDAINLADISEVMQVERTWWPTVATGTTLDMLLRRPFRR